MSFSIVFKRPFTYIFYRQKLTYEAKLTVVSSLLNSLFKCQYKQTINRPYCFSDVPFVQVLSTTYSVLFGGTIDLGCQVKANPSATNVYWQKLLNGVLITVDMSTNNFNKYSGSTVQSPSLTIISTTESDQGNYICSAINSAGTSSSSQTFLDVVGSMLRYN